MDKSQNVPDCSWFESMLTRHRGLFATLFLLPVSVIYSAFLSLRNQTRFILRSGPRKHTRRVERVQDQIHNLVGSRELLCTGRSGWTSMSELLPGYKRHRYKIAINMHDVLEINASTHTVKVEPLVTMGQITATLNERGWTLPVVPELEDLTVGGLINGFGIEASSHKYGLFQFICESFEIVTAKGECVVCSKTVNSDLYYSIPWSHGTLGFLVSAELRMIPAKKYVKLLYQPVETLDEMVRVFERESRNSHKNEFVEAIVYSRDSAVVMTGAFADIEENDGPVNAIGHFWKPWFYKHVQCYREAKKTGCEYIPLRHYYHRHTRSYFWTMNEIISFGNHPLFRFLLGWTLPPKIALLKFTETRTTRRLRDKYYIVQDMLVPMVHLKESIQYFHDHFDLYPLWLSPMAIFDNENKIGFVHPYQSADGTIDELFVDIGAYGVPRKRPFESDQALRELERFVISRHGYQALYAKTLMNREEFRQMFDHTHYDRLRESVLFCAEAFGEVYDKVSSRARISAAEARSEKKRRR